MPFSLLTSRAVSSPRAAGSSASARIHWARCAPVESAQGAVRRARRAASIARSASVKVPVGAAPNGSSVAGQMIGVSSWSLDGCHAPQMKRSVRSWVRVLMSLLLG